MASKTGNVLVTKTRNLTQYGLHGSNVRSSNTNGVDLTYTITVHNFGPTLTLTMAAIIDVYVMNSTR